MKNITIDCRGFVPRSDLHKAFADALAFPDHYGNNLDALHDCLTDISEDTRIHLVNWADAEEKLVEIFFCPDDAAVNDSFFHQGSPYSSSKLS